MAINLNSLQSPEMRPAIITIVGEGGIGKTSLAASFPKPVIIRTEDGTASLAKRKDVKLFPLAASSGDVFEAVQSLAESKHPFKTLIIDSVTQLNTMIETEIVASDPKKPRSINQALGGYGAGLSATADRHRQLRDWCQYLSAEKDMNIVFIAHAISETIDPPDSDAYTRYSIRMNQRSVSHYSDNVDLVGFIKLKTFTHGEGERKKAISDGQRIITCYPTANHISKNRFGIDADLVFNKDENPLAEYIPMLAPKTSAKSNSKTQE